MRRSNTCTTQSARLMAWALGLAVLVGPSQAVWAQAAAAEPALQSADAREAFRRGEAAYSAGNYEVAIREWKSAFESDPRPRIQFNLSQAYERMGQLENAIGALEAFLDSGDPDDPTYSDANARLVSLRQRLANTGVMVKGGAEGGLILVDEQDWGRTPRPDKIRVTPGSHVLAIRWPDGREFRTSIFVPAGQVVEVAVTGEGAPLAGKPATDSKSVAASTDGAPKDRRILWYSLGGGLAGVGTGLLVYGIVRKMETSDCSDSGTYCDPGAEDSANTQAIAGLATGSVMLAAGAALIVYSAVTSKKSDKQTAKTQCGIGFASAACRFTF